MVRGSGSAPANLWLHKDDQTIFDTNDLGSIKFSGHNGTDSVIGGRIWMEASEDWSGSTNSTRMSFSTVDGTTSNTGLVIEPDGAIQLPQYTAGYLKSDASGNITVDTSTIEDTLQSVTDRGDTTTNTIEFTGSANAYVGIQGETDINLKIGTGAGTEPRMYLFGSANGESNAGNIFIGTANNTGIVDINGDIDVSGFAGFNGITTPDFPVDISSVDGGKVLRSTRGTSIFRIDQSNDGPGYIGMQSADDLSIQTNNTSKIYIKSAGNVGIGTTNPSSILDIQNVPSGGSGTILNIGLDANNPVRAKIHTESYNGAFSLYDSGSNEDVKITTSGNSYFNGGNVGINTTNPLYRFHLVDNTNSTWSTKIQSDTVGTFISHDSGYGMALRSTSSSSSIYLMNLIYGGTDTDSGGSSAFFVRADGNVGIGTAAPTQKLEVSGNIET